MKKRSFVARIIQLCARVVGRGPARLLSVQFPQYSIGRASYGRLKVIDFGEGATLKVGAFCSFAVGVQVMLGGNHRPDWTTTYPFSARGRRFAHIQGHPVSRGDVLIGNDVWIGHEALILSGVTIGDGAVVGARSVVSRDVPPYGVVAGNPARLIRYRFSPEVVERLLSIKWWNWADSRIDEAVPLMLKPEVENFLDAVESPKL